jgi:hypothetical protein
MNILDLHLDLLGETGFLDGGHRYALPSVHPHLRGVHVDGICRLCGKWHMIFPRATKAICPYAHDNLANGKEATPASWPQ